MMETKVKELTVYKVSFKDPSKGKFFNKTIKRVATDDIEKILESGFIKGLGKITIKPHDTITIII